MDNIKKEIIKDVVAEAIIMILYIIITSLAGALMLGIVVEHFLPPHVVEFLEMEKFISRMGYLMTVNIVACVIKVTLK